MSAVRSGQSIVRGAAAAAGAAVGAYAAYVAVTWLRYGPHRPSGAGDDLLDRFMPECDVAERHRTRVAAPADITLAAAKDMRLMDVAIIRAIFRARELLLCADASQSTPAGGVVEQTTALGWGLLAEVPGREIVMGAVTRPWEANVTFRAIAPEQFAAFAEPNYVKIIWTLRADPIDAASSWFSSETRATATDSQAATKFRRYWSLLSPGIILIRRLMLGPLRREASRRAQLTAEAGISPIPTAARGM